MNVRRYCHPAKPQACQELSWVLGEIRGYLYSAQVLLSKLQQST